jgi:hypothetical protein
VFTGKRFAKGDVLKAIVEIKQSDLDPGTEFYPQHILPTSVCRAVDD